MRCRGTLPLSSRVLSIGLLVGSVLGIGCIGYLPETVALVPGAANVEVVSDPPNIEVYEPAGEVSAQVVGRETGEALRQAANELRNQAAARGATFVSIEEVSSRS